MSDFDELPPPPADPNALHPLDLAGRLDELEHRVAALEDLERVRHRDEEERAERPSWFRRLRLPR